MTAPQKAKEAMQKIVNGEEVSCFDLMNIRACLTYSSACLEGLDHERYTPKKVIGVIDRTLSSMSGTITIPAVG